MADLTSLGYPGIEKVHLAVMVDKENCVNGQPTEETWKSNRLRL